MTEQRLTHLDEHGHVYMVNVGEKPDNERYALAKGEVILNQETVNIIKQGLLKKGDVLTIAQIAGIMGAKKTAELIPLCHQVPLNHIEVSLKIDELLPGIQIQASTKTVAKTGVEMEALTAVSLAALTVYDMVKAVEKTGKINNIRLVEKYGGIHGDIVNE